MTLHRPTFAAARKDTFQETPLVAAIREELRAKGIMEKVDAARAARGLPARGQHRPKTLAHRAQAHLDAGGCSGDFCPHCHGTGDLRMSDDTCWFCNGKGMGK